jgi:hypothetical protein
VVFLTTEAEIMEAAEAAGSPDDLFFLMEEAGVMVRIDRSMTPTMAKIATWAHWELDRLRTIERVVRLGHIVHVKPGRLMLADGEVGIARDAVVTHCAARDLRFPHWCPCGDGGDHAADDPQHVCLLRSRTRGLRGSEGGG